MVGEESASLPACVLKSQMSRRWKEIESTRQKRCPSQRSRPSLADAGRRSFSIDLLLLVTVTTFTHLPGPVIPEPELVNTVTDWLSRYWQTLGMIGVGLVGLGLLRSMIRAVPAAAAPPEPAEMFAARFPENAAGNEGQPAAPVGGQAVRNRLKRRTPHGPSLWREELSELVKEDPDTAKLTCCGHGSEIQGTRI